MPAFSIARGCEVEHAAALKRGIEALPHEFAASVCSTCKGRGSYEQTYTAGCGGGYYRSQGGCDYCDGTGLIQGTKPAPASVRNQVLCAASSNKNLENTHAPIP